MREDHPSHFKSWTAADEAKLRSMIRGGYSDMDIACAVGRTRAAVRTQRGKLGLYRCGSNGGKWSKAEVDLLVSLSATDLPDAEIARIIGRSKGSIKEKRCRLKFKRNIKTMWKPSEDETIAALLLAGLTYKKIGSKLGKTRNAIAGRVSWLRHNGVIQMRNSL